MNKKGLIGIFMPVLMLVLLISMTYAFVKIQGVRESTEFGLAESAIAVMEQTYDVEDELINYDVASRLSMYKVLGSGFVGGECNSYAGVSIWDEGCFISEDIFLSVFNKYFEEYVDHKFYFVLRDNHMYGNSERKSDLIVGGSRYYYHPSIFTEVSFDFKNIDRIKKDLGTLKLRCGVSQKMKDCVHNRLVEFNRMPGLTWSVGADPDDNDKIFVFSVSTKDKLLVYDGSAKVSPVRFDFAYSLE